MQRLHSSLSIYTHAAVTYLEAPHYNQPSLGESLLGTLDKGKLQASVTTATHMHGKALQRLPNPMGSIE